jgi:hypothetical protein
VKIFSPQRKVIYISSHSIYFGIKRFLSVASSCLIKEHFDADEFDDVTIVNGMLEPVVEEV